jgi:hypothetical protein
MKKFEDFLKEGKKIQIKRRYTENHPASTVGKTASVRNAVLKAVKDGVITEEEFTKILSELSGDHRQWRTRNTKYFNVSEEGIKLSKWGLRILAELDEEPKAAGVFEATVVMDAMDPKSKILKKLLKKHKVTMKVLDPSGPSGWPEVELTGSREDLQSVLASPDGWDDPELGEYIEESAVNEKIKVTKDEWPYIEFKDGGKKHKVEFDYEDIIDDHGNEGQDQYWIGKDEDGQEWQIDVSADYRGEVMEVWFDTLIVAENKLAITEKYEVIFSDGIVQGKKFKREQQALDFMKKEIASNKKLRDIAVYKPGMHSTTQTELVVKFWGDGSYLDNVSKKDKDLASKKLQENINMENTFSIHESFSAFTGANGFLNEKLGSQILASILMGNKEGKHGKENLKRLAGGFYQMTKVALDKIQDEDFIVDNEPQKAFKNHGGSKNIIFFISDNEKENPYLPDNSGSYGSLATIPGGGILLAAMGGDREFYTNDWSRYSKNRSWKKDGRKGAPDQIGVNKKYRGWGASGLNNGKRIAEVSDRVIIVNLDLIRQKYSTQQLRDARAAAKAGATAFKSDKDFKAENKNRYHQILATKAASMPIDKMVEGAIDELGNQIKAGLNAGEKTKYGEIKIGENSKGREVKLRDASNHMSNILDNYSRYCDYIKQGEESEARYGQAESYYERESKNYAKEIKDQISKIKGFDYAW